MLHAPPHAHTHHLTHHPTYHPTPTRTIPRTALVLRDRYDALGMEVCTEYDERSRLFGTRAAFTAVGVLTGAIFFVSASVLSPAPLSTSIFAISVPLPLLTSLDLT
jgi:hypothetical protein